MVELLVVAVLFWSLMLAIGAIDGLYFHLFKFRLFARPASRFEHLLHTIRALLLIPGLGVALLGWGDLAPKPRLIAILVLFALDWIAGLSDAFVEEKSRKDLGGLPRAEYMIHVGATALHSVAEALTVTAWALASEPLVLPSWARASVELMVITGAIGALAHVVLLAPGFSAKTPSAGRPIAA